MGYYNPSALHKILIRKQKSVIIQLVDRSFFKKVFVIFFHFVCEIFQCTYQNAFILYCHNLLLSIKVHLFSVSDKLLIENLLNIIGRKICFKIRPLFFVSNLLLLCWRVVFDNKFVERIEKTIYFYGSVIGIFRYGIHLFSIYIFILMCLNFKLIECSLIKIF